MRKLIAVLISLVVLSSGPMILIARAADQKPPTTAPAAAKPTTPKPAPPGAPQVPEESATIRDDPTIAPDPKQSADNNVSFPNDI
jgi:hypothetical protein